MDQWFNRALQLRFPIETDPAQIQLAAKRAVNTVRSSSLSSFLHVSSFLLVNRVHGTRWHPHQAVAVILTPKILLMPVRGRQAGHPMTRWDAEKKHDDPTR